MARKKVKNKISSKKSTKYSVQGDKLIRKPSCPKCGAGIFLAEHKDRSYCGKCHYTEFKPRK
jgi:small subunit ribosomal protein S27Ae